MEHRARRSAGRARLRVEPEAIAADNRLRYCPLHRGQRVGGNACCVGEARQIVARQRRGWQEAQREREQEQHAQKSFLHGIPRCPGSLGVGRIHPKNLRLPVDKGRRHVVR